jgi:hypothetical protein
MVGPRVEVVGRTDQRAGGLQREIDLRSGCEIQSAKPFDRDSDDRHGLRADQQRPADDGGVAAIDPSPEPL